MAAISGKLLQVTYNGVKINCQTNGTLTITKDVTTEDPCKDGDTWNEGVVSSKSWSLSVDAKQFLDTVPVNQMDLIQAMIASDDVCQVEFLTTPGDHNNPQDMVFSGDAFLTNLSLETPANATATYTADFTGNGAPTMSRINVTT